MNVLVTGGFGFIGSALVRRLLTDGHNVIVIDNMFDPVARVLPSTGFTGKFVFYPYDVRDWESIKSIDLPIDAVFHFAAHYANTRSLQEPLESVSINMLGTMTLLELCRLKGAKLFVYASSSGVYGSVDCVAYAENMPPRPSTPYEVTKYSGELLCDGYCTIYGISLVAPRLFNVYGIGDVGGEWRAVIPNFFSLALRNEPLVVTGGRASRDFTYIDDVIDAIFAGVKHVSSTPDQVSLVYNIGTGSEVFITKLAKLIVELTGSKSEVVIDKYRHWDNAPRRVSDCHKFRALFPDVAAKMRLIDKGLADSKDWYIQTCSTDLNKEEF